MSKYETLEQLREAARQNSSKLRDCPRHVFIKNEDPEVYIPRYTCEICSGIVGQAEKVYYELGVLHGSKVENT